MSEKPKTKKIPNTTARIARKELAAMSAHNLNPTLQTAIYEARYTELQTAMSERGYTEEQINTVKASMIEFHTQLSQNIIPIKDIIHKLDKLLSLGFKNPVTLIEKMPPILGLASDSVQEKIDRLVDLGFSNTVTLIEKLPSILNLASDSIDNKIERLKSLGFSDPVNLIEKLPPILGLASDSVQEKVDRLIDIGFKNPVTLIEKMPSILSLASDSVQEKVDRLRSLGFSKPVELIQKMPPILGLASDSVQQKVRTMFRVYHVMDPSITQEAIVNMIENSPAVLTYSRSRWSLVARSLSCLKEKGIDITKYSQLTSLNSLYTASLPRYYQEGDSLKNIITRVKQVDKEILEEQLAYYEKDTSEDPYEKLTRLFKNTGKK